mmetsp:Transcript_12730/g.18360  ORF Transcript_12730/g.18360 Transcript_12730/m.18360 type:complete len:232 (+) Transcript_12730:3527-4222(+)
MHSQTNSTTRHPINRVSATAMPRGTPTESKHVGAMMTVRDGKIVARTRRTRARTLQHRIQPRTLARTQLTWCHHQHPVLMMTETTTMITNPLPRPLPWWTPTVTSSGAQHRLKPILSHLARAIATTRITPVSPTLAGAMSTALSTAIAAKIVIFASVIASSRSQRSTKGFCAVLLRRPKLLTCWTLARRLVKMWRQQRRIALLVRHTILTQLVMLHSMEKEAPPHERAAHL